MTLRIDHVVTSGVFSLDGDDFDGDDFARSLSLMVEDHFQLPPPLAGGKTRRRAGEDGYAVSFASIVTMRTAPPVVAFVSL